MILYIVLSVAIKSYCIDGYKHSNSFILFQQEIWFSKIKFKSSNKRLLNTWTFFHTCLIPLWKEFLTKVQVLVRINKQILSGHCALLLNVYLSIQEQKFLLFKSINTPIFFKIVFLYTYMEMKIKVAWSVDHESTHVNIYLIRWKWHLKCRWNVLSDCHKMIESKM